MSKKKSRPGVCDQCGRPVVRLEYAIVQTGCIRHENDPRIEIQGHNFHEGKLVRVGCRLHAPDLYPEYNRTGW